MATFTIVAANAANTVTCVIDSETGQVGIDTVGQQVITTGEGPDGSFSVAQSVAVGNVTAVSIGTFADATEQPIAAVAEDGAVYLQLIDGTLVKVAANSVPLDDDRHDEDDDSPSTSESDGD